MNIARPPRGESVIPWYKRSVFAPVWLTLVLALVFGGVILLMSFDIQGITSTGAVAQHDQ